MEGDRLSNSLSAVPKVVPEITSSFRSPMSFPFCWGVWFEIEMRASRVGWAVGKIIVLMQLSFLGGQPLFQKLRSFVEFVVRVCCCVPKSEYSKLLVLESSCLITFHAESHFWHSRIFTFWCFDIVTCWHLDVLTCRRFDILAFWHCHVLTWWLFEMLAFWFIGFLTLPRFHLYESRDFAMLTCSSVDNFTFWLFGFYILTFWDFNNLSLLACWHFRISTFR